MRNYSQPFTILILLLLLLISCNREEDQSAYVSQFTGDWNFTVQRESWGYNYSGHKYDTINFSGTIVMPPDARGLIFYYCITSSLSVWIEDGTILKDAVSLGTISDNELQFTYARGTFASGTRDKVSGTAELT